MPEVPSIGRATQAARADISIGRRPRKKLWQREPESVSRAMIKADGAAPTSKTTTTAIAVAYPRFDDNDPHKQSETFGNTGRRTFVVSGGGSARASLGAATTPAAPA